jgi:TPR repeat protein
MRDSSWTLAALLIFISAWPAAAQSQDTSSLILACDQAAASPSDGDRPAGIVGVRSETLDPQAAIAACEAAAAVAPDAPRVLFELGRAQAAAKEYESARQQFSRASDLAYAAARTSLGSFYANGLGGLVKDDREALRLFKLAAEQSDSLAINNLGFFYESARGGLPKDETEAARLYKLAADQGDAAGRQNLGRFYQNGRGGLPQSDQEAARLYRLAADQGNAFAQGNLGFFYEAGRGGLRQDDAESARLYRLAAEQGVPFAQYKLATFYEEGRGGLTRNNGEAARLFKLAAEQDRNPRVKQMAQEALTRFGASSADAASSRTPVIGVLSTTAPSSAAPISGFRSALKEAGFIEGKNVAIEFHWANNRREMDDIAADIAGRKVAVIVALNGVAAAQAAKAATDSIPIVIVGGADPVQAGLVESFNRPGSNVTGITYINSQLDGKRLGILLDLVPGASTIGYLVGPLNGGAAPDTKELLDVARSAGRQVVVIECRSLADFDAAFEELSQRQATGLIVSAFPLANNNRRKIVALAEQYRIPAIYTQPPYVFEGGLMSYAGTISDRQIVEQYIVPILKGTKPSDIPFQTPSRFELILNLRTAKALGLEVPATLLVTADRVIE